MTKKKDPLKEFSSEQLLRELVARCQNQITLHEVEVECAQAEVDELEETFTKLEEIILGW